MKFIPIRKFVKIKSLNYKVFDAEMYCPDKSKLMYVNCRLNGHPFRALIDTGAQISLIRLDAVKMSGIENEIRDPCFTNLSGIGSTRTKGYIAARKIQLGKFKFDIGFTVTESLPVEILIGIDFLRNYKAVIDLGTNKIFLDGNMIKILE